jgi:iron complex transport system permease protein
MRRILLALRLRLATLRGRTGFWAGAFALALVATALAGAAFGAVPTGLTGLAGAIADRGHPLHAAIWEVRLPRVASGALVGSALAVAGALLQTAVRNPLADAGIVGLTGGAGAAALATLVLFPAHASLVPALAFGGGLLSAALLLAFAWSRSHAAGPLRIVLSGVALQAIFVAAISLLTFAFADRAPSFAAFLVGSLNGLGWSDVRLAAVPTALGLALAFACVRPLDLLLLDDATAGGLGVAVRRARFAASGVSALLAAGAVSVAGLVGFVGLVVPNGVRVLVGPAHGALLPLSALGGGVLVLLADALARTALAPLELPVGALLALIGGPTFLALLWRKLP